MNQEYIRPKNVTGIRSAVSQTSKPTKTTPQQAFFLCALQKERTEVSQLRS